MEILRVPPYPLTTTWTLPIANYEYVLHVEDLVDRSVEIVTLSSDENSKLVYELPMEQVLFDRNLYIKFYDTEEENVLHESNLDVIRPYVNIYELATTASEIAEYKMYELIARSIIDSHVTDGFYNKKQIIQGVGQGTDYFSFWIKVNNILKIYENNALIYDVLTPDLNLYEYAITLDNTSIQRVLPDLYDRSEQAPMGIPVARGDLGYYGYRNLGFPRGFDYTMIVNAGYKTVPADVEKAALFLIEDLKCGKLDYYKRYITSYNTDQFRLQFDKSMFDGTGNFLVDKILDKYANTITKPGLL